MKIEEKLNKINIFNKNLLYPLSCRLGLVKNERVLLIFYQRGVKYNRLLYKNYKFKLNILIKMKKIFTSTTGQEYDG